MTATRDLDPPIALPRDELSTAALDWVRGIESRPVANHSIRSYLFSRLLARHRGMSAGSDYDPRLTFLACVLHDVGLTAPGNGGQRFELDGADLAAGFLTGRGLPAAEVDAVWEAIALHTSAGIAERRGPLVELTHLGIRMDFGALPEVVTAGAAAAIHAAHPRLAMARALTDAIVEQARARPEKAPPYSLPAELLRERTELGVTAIETATFRSRWGE